MADLLTPKTWTSGEVATAANMNSGIRDPINRLNGFADNITNSTAADSGTATYLKITRPVSAGTGHNILEGWEAGDTTPRIFLTAKGYLGFTDGQTFGGHNIFFNAPDGIIETPSDFRADAMEVQSGSIRFLGTPNESTTNQFIEFPSQLAPPTPGTGYVRLFAGMSNGVLRLLARFPNATTRIIVSEDGT